MKRGFLIFWILYALFFAIPFPMLLYYNIKSDDPPTLSTVSPWLALSFLALSLILWAILLAGYFRKWVLLPFSAKRNIARLKVHGVRREAIIRSATMRKSNGSHEMYDLKLSFKNLANTEITESTTVADTKPYERRFEAGKRTEVLIDKNMKHIPHFMLASAEASIITSQVVLRIAAWLTFSALVPCYYIFSYTTENDGAGWRFIVFAHPLLVCAVVLCLYRFIGVIIMKFVGKTEEQVLIKYMGIATRAKVLSVKQTGTYINEQPMMRFELAFTDANHNMHQVTFKRVIGLLQLDITKQENLDIFYLPENPGKIALAADLNNLN